MKYVSLDLETTCIDPKCPENILQIAMVAEDTDNIRPVDELSSFKAIIVPETSTVSGSLTALAMNAWLLMAIEMHKNSGRRSRQDMVDYFVSLGVPSSLVHRAFFASQDNLMGGLQWTINKANEWLDKEFGANSTSIIVAGKNVAGFDMMFLPKDLKRRFAHRTIDPGSVLIDWSKKAPPSSNDLAKLYGNTEGEVDHDAYADAKDVITWLRSSYSK